MPQICNLASCRCTFTLPVCYNLSINSVIKYKLNINRKWPHKTKIVMRYPAFSSSLNVIQLSTDCSCIPEIQDKSQFANTCMVPKVR